uniref:EMI domain-containing protein n=1 Tax=Anabas testudineus TaxID=64144 RepID=A0A3Q1JTK2_ANATE
TTPRAAASGSTRTGWNHCAYVIEKTVSFTVQDGVSPYVKAEYNNRCSWSKKCPTLLYRQLYKPIYKVAHKTVTELEWRCCPGYAGYDCMEGPPVYQHPMKMMPPFKGPPMKGLQFKGPQYKALLSAAPGPIPAPAVASSPSTIGFVEIPGGDPEIEGLDGRQMFPGLTELKGKVEELKTELQVKTAELQELKAMVIGHDGALKKMSNSEGLLSNSSYRAVEKLIDAKLGGARTEILGGFEKRVESAEGRCEEKAGDVRRQCQREQSERQEQMEDVLQESTTDLRTELRNLQAQIHSLKATESCCGRMGGLIERVQQLETSVAGLNQSQGHLRVELGGHKDHIEGILEGRLGYVEDKLNLTGQPEQGLEARMEVKLRALEGRILMALEELGNTSAPTLLEGHAVPALETELESLRGKLEVDVDRIQKHLSSLDILCSSSCSPTQNQFTIQEDSATPSTNLVEQQDVKQVLDGQADRLNNLNETLQNILERLTLRDQQEHAEGELTILKFNFRSVNNTLKGIQHSLGAVIHQVGQANSSWHEREARLAQQVKGVVQLVGHQASMLGAGERRLTRLKGELQEMKRRLAEEVRGCRSTAMGVQKEVTEVGGRVSIVEGQCKGLNYLAEDLERIREELERQSNGVLMQVNGTLSSHTQQLSELRGELRNCTSKVAPTQQSLGPEAESRRGDTFTLN